MKDISLLHYFLGLEVWQGVEEVFLVQKKYTLEILKIFQMLDYKPLATPMVSNMQLNCDEDFNLVDLTLCRQLIRFRMYLVNTKLNICYIVLILNQIYG
jgi:hypothetical protein